MTKPDFASLLRILAEHGVDFVVVGGVGAILQGATLSTFDLDIVHSLDACYRAQPEKRQRQTDLSSPGHQLETVGKRQRYDDHFPPPGSLPQMP